MGISNPREDATATGRAVLQIWNAHVNETLEKFYDLRILVCLRNFETRNFLVFEEDGSRYSSADFNWHFNKRGNLEGYDIAHNSHCFTWQPHGSQFTIIQNIPAHARKFSIPTSIPKVPLKEVLNSIKFEQIWVSIDEPH